MGNPPESFMIYKEELRKAQVEKERLKKEYEKKMAALEGEMSVLKERLGAQEDMMKNALEYAMKLEKKMEHFSQKMSRDSEKNRFGFH